MTLKLTDLNKIYGGNYIPLQEKPMNNTQFDYDFNAAPTSQASAMRQFVDRGWELKPVTPETPLSPQEIAIKNACDALANTLIMKSRDYGTANIDEFGQLGVLVRLGDKYNRLKNLTINNKGAEFEPLEDSWKDMAGYSIIGWLNAQGKW